MSKWTEMKLGDVINLKRGYDLPKDEREKGDIPVVSSSGISGFHNEAKVKAPGVVTGRYGTLGEVYYLKQDFWPHNTTLYVEDFKGNHPRFVSYLLQSISLAAQSGAAAVPGVNRNHLHMIDVTIPSFDTQRQIANVLSAFDDLVEINKKRISLLEQINYALYQEWFVEYKFPDRKKVIKYQEQPPIGWTVSSIDELLTHHIGGGWGKEEPKKDENIRVHVIRGTDIPDARALQIDSVPQRFVKDSHLKSRNLEEGDIIFEVSGGSKDQPVGRALMVARQLLNSFDTPLICASFCKLMRVNQEILHPSILYYHILYIYESREIMKYQVQSTGISNLKFAHFLKDESVIVPPKEIQNAFISHVQPILDEMAALGERVRVLQEASSLLLPRLIAGQLDVSNIEIPFDGA